ncbi:hypothetical protein DSO57_1019240 [Entomophthora muscae]|uniref:Uncharacterized protein n=1 Tax=Entomophthora muscae TaxID=34485 RepID=A0ACC2UCZ9_9FUNG|nr:hypothetical protein DSO57_1019240 [Entomophthora muscae]
MTEDAPIMRPQVSRRAYVPYMTSLRSCLITDEESEPILRSLSGHDQRLQSYDGNFAHSIYK